MLVFLCESTCAEDVIFVVDIVTDVPGHSGARQVLVQGNAIKTVVKLLEG